MAVLFLTGADGALGTVIGRHFKESGWKVAGFDRLDQASSLDFHAAVDATSESSVQEAFSRAVQAVGVPSAIICTIGGVSKWKRAEEMSGEEFMGLINLNLLSAFLTAKSAFSLMKEQGGAIMTIGAEAALRAESKKVGYGAAKAGVVSLTQTLAEEGKAFGISANCIVPNTIRTKANEEWGAPEDIPKWTDPAHITELCMFLTTPAGRAVNGSVIRIPNRM